MGRVLSTLAATGLAAIIGASGYAGEETESNPQKITESENPVEKTLFYKFRTIKIDETKGTLEVRGQIRYRYTNQETSEKREVIPSRAKIKIDEKEFDLNLDAEGKFLFTDTDEKYKKPEEKKFYSILEQPKPIILSAEEDNEKDKNQKGLRVFRQIGTFNIYSESINEPLLNYTLHKIMESRAKHVQIYLFEKDTRVPIAPKTTVTCIDSDAGLETIVKEEFATKELQELALKRLKKTKEQYLKTFLDETDKKKEINRFEEAFRIATSIEFYAIKGAKYHIETVDPRFYHFEEEFVADGVGKKSILLVKISEKVGKEKGERGELINSAPKNAE